MKKILISSILICLFLHLKGQVVVTNPSMVTEGSAISLTFYANEGTMGLLNFTGDIYAHTGVITNQSTSDSDWRYTIADWAENLPKAKLIRSGTNTYQLMISPDIRTFYNVPETETIEKLAFVFRSADGAKEGKDVGGKDIMISVYASGVNVSFSKPVANYSVVAPQSTLAININASNNDKIDLYLNQDLLITSSATTLNYNLEVPAAGKFMLRAVATGGSGQSADTCWMLVHEAPLNAPRPAGLRRGINRVDDQSVTALLFAPDKEFVYLSGDFNDWMPGLEHQMKKDGDYFWLTLTNLAPDHEYGYQYWIDNQLKIADPYTNMILDPNNDKYISSAVYPNLKAYPTGKTEEYVSVFKTNPAQYQWMVTNFTPPAADTMVVYELLIRDFTFKRDIKTVTDTLAYLKRLGVNAIELMPFNEFEGNDSWGYNPALYFATDKAYGTIEDYKQFVDACHENGMAVIQDMVLNHSFGQSPFVRMYFDGSKPAANNPWYNVNHNMQNTDAQWGYDFNHESAETQALVDSICQFWMDEFNIDGFRFDFTKGFTNTVYGPSDWASAYDASRIAILKRMVNQIRVHHPQAIVIFEHLSDNSEEKELAEHGILLWGNHNHNFNEATMGFTDDNKSDVSWANYKSRGWTQPHIVNYMESHDEERLMAKNLLYGSSLSNYNTKDVNTSLQRLEAAGVVLFSIPGPSMIWQFGELGYDVSIDENGRTGQKPLHWEYQQVAERTEVYNTWSAMINLKKKEPVFASSDFTMDVKGAVKQIYLSATASDVLVIANFALKSQTVSVQLGSTGWWYNYFAGDSINVTNKNHSITLGAGEYRILSQKHLWGFDKMVVPVEPIRDNNAFAFPNPTAGPLTVYNPFDEAGAVTLYSFVGRKIGQLTIDESMPLDLTGFSAGVYFIKIDTNKGSAIQKIVKH